MKNIVTQIKNIVEQGIEIAVPFLCLGVVVQLITGSPLFGWNVVGICWSLNGLVLEFC